LYRGVGKAEEAALSLYNGSHRGKRGMKKKGDEHKLNKYELSQTYQVS
jgi:hypothetical protein